MIRTCPRCGDFYAGDALAFCTADGTPLVDVATPGEGWSEGARVVEEKTKALRKRERRLRWRRWMWSAVTTLLVTLVVCVLAVNVYIYLGPKQKDVALVPSSTPTPTPTPTPSPTPSPTPTPTPTPVYIISGRVTVGDAFLSGVNVMLDGAKSSSTKTDSHGRYSFGGLPEGGSYTVTPDGAPTTFTPRSHSVKNLARDVSADFAGTAPPECVFADEVREEQNIKEEFADSWLKLIRGEREKVIAEHTPPRDSNDNRRAPLSDNRLALPPDNRRTPPSENGRVRPSPDRRAPVLRNNATLVEPLQYEIRFPGTCRASVTVTYEWRVRHNVNGRWEDVPVAGRRRIECKKDEVTWRCGDNLSR
ncbi:MAG TPA: carboxypeptidase-like regulatory domain-containing protein [Pyrinomonadaceae bacterium]|jgi:hypothetical protein